MKKLKVGVLGATGMVGQRFLTLLEKHPWFSVVAVAASPSSAGKLYREAVAKKWSMKEAIPPHVADLTVLAVEDELEKIAAQVDFVFCALDMEKEDIKRIEVAYAKKGVPVVSNNSAHRWAEDIPMIIPEINPQHTDLIDIQKKKRGFEKGFIAVKPNCSIQSYVAILTALKAFEPELVDVVSLQAISGAGKTFTTWSEMVDNVNPLIGAEEEKSEKEPHKIWGSKKPLITATCIRVPVSDGHMARVRVKFGKKPTKEQIIVAVKNFSNPLQDLGLPSAPLPFIKYFEEPDRPQTRLDRDYGHGMGITMGRLMEDQQGFDFRFISLSHNTIRGAAGGAILMAELLVKKGYIA